MGKVILVTGASSGMGRNAAIRLAQEGHVVYGLARRIDRMKELVDAGGHALELDITRYDGIGAAVERVIEEQGRIDVLWNNAGYSVMGAVEDVSLEDAKRQFEVNLFGVSELTKAVLPHMRRRRSGTIINTSSVGGKIFTPLSAWYHASKHALEGWSDCLRIEVEPFGINVVILEPGGIKTEFGDVLMGPLLERSEGGAYEVFSRRVAASFRKQYDENNRQMSHPSVISDAVSRIVRLERPKTRYAVGYASRTVLLMRRFLSDRLFERLIVQRLT